MKVELTFPPELLDRIVEDLFERIKPLVTTLGRHKAATEDDVIFDVAGLSEYLEVSKKWVYEQTHLKMIPHFKLGNKQLRFRKKDIDAWLINMKVPCASTYPIKPKKPMLFNKLRRCE
jgi:excisionase family DNA binding protein